MVVGMFATNIAIQLLNMCTGVLTARALGPDGRGGLAAVLMWPQFLAFCVALGLPASLVFHLKKQPSDAPQLIGASLASSAVLSTAAGVFGALALPYWLAGYPHQVVVYAQLAMAATPLCLVSLILLTAVQGFESFTAFNWLRLAGPLLTVVGLGIIAASRGLTWMSAAAVYLIVPIPVTAWNAHYLFRQVTPSLADLRARLSTLFSYGVRYSVADFAGTLASQADRAVIAGFLPPSDLGLYVVAQTVAGLLTMISATVSTILFPRAAGIGHASALQLTLRSAAQSGAASVLAGVPLALLGPWLIGIVYGSDFRHAGSVVALLVAASAANVVSTVLLQGFLATGRPGAASMTQTFAVAAALALLWLLTPSFGLTGVALAMLGAALGRLAILVAAIVALARRSAGDEAPA